MYSARVPLPEPPVHARLPKTLATPLLAYLSNFTTLQPVVAITTRPYKYEQIVRRLTAVVSGPSCYPYPVAASFQLKLHCQSVAVGTVVSLFRRLKFRYFHEKIIFLKVP